MATDTGVNLGDRIKRQLPVELVDFLHLAGEVAGHLNQQLYLVGGVVRDLLLERKNLDLDLVAEGDAIKLAEELAKLKKGKVIAHSRFNTAKIRWDKWSVDVAAARNESYDKPGALPKVQSSDIQSDLVRRDFTINAMAVALDPFDYGEIIDPHGGQDDLAKKLVRVLHDSSFIDDATRIWRAVRYEQRLDFSIEPHTLELLKRDISYLDSIGGNRMRHELELCLEEERPEKALSRANELGILKKIHPSFRANGWAGRKIAHARNVLQPYCPPQELYLALLFYHLTTPELEHIIAYLNFPRSVSQTLQDTLKLKECLTVLIEPQVMPSQIYHCVHGYSQSAIVVNLMATNSPAVREHIELYLKRLHSVQPLLNGEALINLGMDSGPRLKETLEILREAKLDGRVTTLEEEISLVKHGLKS